MADLQMRPRFAVDVACDLATLVAMLEENTAQADPPLEGHFGPHHCVMRIPRERRALWSPELDLTFEPVEAGAEDRPPVFRVRCLFAPRPAVWTGFAFVFAVLGAVSVAGGLFGLAQLSLGETPTGLWVLPVAATLAGLTYASSFIGRGLALSQLYELRRTFDAGVSEAEAHAHRQVRELQRSYQI